jgi:hypothetical protein
MAKPVLTHVIYRPRKGKEKEIEALVRKHWKTLDGVGLVTKEPARVWRAVDKRKGAVSFIEIFSWKDEKASDTAHQTPEVMAIWEPMEAILEELRIEALEPL